MSFIKLNIDDKRKLNINPVLYSNLRILSSKLEKGDVVILLDGGEGVGKSTLAQQIATIFDPHFSANYMCFSSEEYINKGRLLPSYRAIVLDEGGEIMSRKAMSLDNTNLVRFMFSIRKRHLIHIFAIPKFTMLESYIAQTRAQILLHLVEKYVAKKNPIDDYWQKGEFFFYSAARKGELYETQRRKNSNNYTLVSANFKGQFSDEWLISTEMYDQKKDKFIENITGVVPDDKQVKLDEFKEQRDKLIKAMYEEKELSITKIARILDVPVGQIGKVVKGTGSTP